MIIAKIFLSYAFIQKLIAESDYTDADRYRKMVLAEGNLGHHNGLFRKLISVKYLIGTLYKSRLALVW